MEKKAEYNSIKITADASSIYEDGALLPMSVDEVCNNKAAVKQLMNQHNLAQIQFEEIKREFSEYKSDVEFLKTTPFISTFVAIFNIIASVLIAILVNLYTNNPNDNTYVILLILSGAVLLCSSILNIFYPYIKKWFNSRKEKNNG